MERFTGKQFIEEEDDKNWVVPIIYDFYRKLYNRLKEYEDTGFTPEEIISMAEFNELEDNNDER